jgi:hypothetical protein
MSPVLALSVNTYGKEVRHMAHNHSREVPFGCFAVDMLKAEHDACTPLGSVPVRSVRYARCSSAEVCNGYAPVRAPHRGDMQSC